MQKSSTFLIHDCRTKLSGSFTHMQSEFDECKKLQNYVLKYYQKYSNISNNELKEAFNSQTVYSAQECLEMGFIDKIL